MAGYLRVTWEKCERNSWCELEKLDLDSIPVDFGVYVIWKAGIPSRRTWPETIYAGSGNIADRLGGVLKIIT